MDPITAVLVAAIADEAISELVTGLQQFNDYVEL
jgi:hypothetical protein